ncbi:MAG: hydroxypyruvate isomerase, partial [Paracoccus sp. (in: a-proteobacteria)]
MPRFAANLTMLFTELPLQQRFAAAAAAGFEGAEILFPYDIAVSDLSRAAIRAGLEIVLIN